MSQLKPAENLTKEVLDVIHKYDGKIINRIAVIGVLEIIKAGLILERVKLTDGEE